MARTRRTFTPEEGLSLLKEAEREGFAETCRQPQFIADPSVYMA